MNVYYDPRMTAAVVDGSTPSHMKPQWLFERASETSIPIDWCTVVPAEWSHLESVHDRGYVDAVRTGRPLDTVEAASVTWSPELAESLLWQTGSMVCAARDALSVRCTASFSSGCW